LNHAFSRKVLPKWQHSVLPDTLCRKDIGDLDVQPCGKAPPLSQDIAPEALPLLVKISPDFKRNTGHPMTVREARWVSRLRSLYEPRAVRSLSLGKLISYVHEYTWLEKMRWFEPSMDISSERTDLELYVAVTGKPPVERVFDSEWQDAASRAGTDVLFGELEP
jgi:hypothetical protein